jgi:hypothetical protein
MARPERFELPTARFVAEYSIQLSYGRFIKLTIILIFLITVNYYYYFNLAESEGFEPSMGDKAHTPLAGERLQPLGQLS